MQLGEDLLPLLRRLRAGHAGAAAARGAARARRWAWCSRRGLPGGAADGRSASRARAVPAAAPGVPRRARRAQDGALVTAGGRVLTVCARGQDLAEARARAYARGAPHPLRGHALPAGHRRAGGSGRRRRERRARSRRYLLRELLVPLVVWVAFLFLLLFVMQFLRGTEVLLGSGGDAAGTSRRLILYLAPHFLVMALPVALPAGHPPRARAARRGPRAAALQALGVDALAVARRAAGGRRRCWAGSCCCWPPPPSPGG